MGSPLKPDRPCIVEFVGLPGSGKTTIVTRLCESGGMPGFLDGQAYGARLACRGEGRGPRLRRPLLALIKAVLAMGWIGMHPKAFYALLRHTIALNRQPLALAWKRLKQFFSCLAHLTWINIYRRFAAMPAEYLLLDQGLLQAIVSLDLGNSSFPSAVLTAIPLPDVVIYLDAGAGVASQRLFSRTGGTSRLDRMHASDASRLMGDLEKSFALFIDALQRLTPVRVIRMTSRREDTPEHVARAIAKELACL